MELKKILSISGKPGLYKLLATTKSAVVVESLVDGKRFSVFRQYDISSLGDISIYTETGDEPLEEILKRIFKSTGGKPVEVDLNDVKALMAFFENVLPEYDKENVYPSHIKKVVKWYNLLLDKGLLDFEDKEEKSPEEQPEQQQENGAGKEAEEANGNEEAGK